MIFARNISLLGLCLILAGCIPSKDSPTAPGVDPVIENWLRRNAVPLPPPLPLPGGELTDIAALDEIVSSARVVAIGACSYGAAEFTRLRQQLSHYLIERAGFRVIALEAEWTAVEPLSDYVTGGDGDPATLLGDLYPWLNSAEMLEFVEWLRSYNLVRPDSARIALYGIDMRPYPETAMARVVDYLATVDLPAAQAADSLYACFREFSENPYIYAAADTALKNRCERQIEDVFFSLVLNQSAYAALSEPRRTARVIHTARVVMQSHDYWSSPRDANFFHRIYMMENLDWILANHRDGGTKILLWGHNQHISIDSDRLGGELWSALLADYVTIAATAYQGAITIFPESKPEPFAIPQEEPVNWQLEIPPSNGYEFYLNGSGYAQHLLDVRGIELGSPETDWVVGPHGLRTIGSCHPNPNVAFFPARLPLEFDAVLFIQQVTPAILLD